MDSRNKAHMNLTVDQTLSLCNKKSRPSSSNKGGEIDLFTQLWLECAGPLVKIPRTGDKVFYFPQGHIEQVEAYMRQDGSVEMPPYNLPSRILCKVVHIQLKAEPNTDEVFAQICLLPEHEEPTTKGSIFMPIKQMRQAASFSKRLTPSDTSTHGGFSIPKRHADECFPPLDMIQEVPTQEIVAKDLHGIEWHFRHIYRGNPRRHLLSTGWSLFVGAKNLVPGDTCMFLRGEMGELYVGVRRASRPQISPSALSSISMQHGILATAFHALSTGTMFTVYYRPWTNPCEFIVTYDEYMKATEIDYAFGSRFRMQVACEEGPGHKCPNFSGTVIGVSDIDRIRWPGSDWRRLKVQWDASPDRPVLPERVSPWSIEPSGIINMTKKNRPSSISINQKRPRPSDPSIPDLPFLVVKDGLWRSSVENAHQRLSMVLQGQEIKASENPRGKYMLFGVNISNTNSKPSSSKAIDIPETSNCISCDLPEQQCQNCNSITNRSCTKVLKHGTALGRSVDLNCFHGYDELIAELDQMFDFEGTLINRSSGWLINYSNREGDKILLGGSPWPEFKAAVKKMFIYPKEDVNRVD